MVFVRSGSTLTRTRRSGRSITSWCFDSSIGVTMSAAERAISLRSASTARRVTPPSSRRADSIISSISSFISDTFAAITPAAIRPRSLSSPSKPASSMDR